MFIDLQLTEHNLRAALRKLTAYNTSGGLDFRDKNMDSLHVRRQTCRVQSLFGSASHFGNIGS